MAVTREKVANIAKAVSMITEAARRGSKLAILPECFNCPYGTKYFAEYSESLVPGNPTYDAISNCARKNSIWVIAGSIPEKASNGKVFNSSMTFGPDGALRHVHRKVHLFRINTDSVRFDEGEVLTAGESATAITMDAHTKFGVGICFDMRYPLLAWNYASQGTSFIAYPGAFNMVTGPLHWELSGRARAVDNQQFVFLCSPARDTSAEYVAWGHSMVVDPMGNVVGELDEKEGFLDCQVDLGVIADTRNRIPIMKGVRNDLYHLVWKKH
ncbi:putative nitrilase [Leptomonas seymouri]|uniref:Putative nitrilase n=1 Tax=Leptomonas seymouri TaxID=5684 RepID=A0A0N1I1H1_LEPSE|nr:putative nitrilase [Leptomonas seymouri]|eukprot:KPI83185.1 putative nitrilase [Leptomonas seymouri]